MVEGLTRALVVRSLPWALRRFDSVRGAWGARDAWGAWGAWDAWGAWNARNARNAGGARDAWGAWGAWDTRDAWGARDALTVYYAAKRGWISCAADKLTVGLRKAYAAGLGIALPTGTQELGWGME